MHRFTHFNRVVHASSPMSFLPFPLPPAEDTAHRSADSLSGFVSDLHVLCQFLFILNPRMEFLDLCPSILNPSNPIQLMFLNIKYSSSV